MAKGAWTLRQLQFQSSKTAGCQRQHIEQMVWRWPGTAQAQTSLLRRAS